MAGNSRADSARRVAELTGLGIAATYFLDPTHGAQRRRAAWGWVTGGRGDREAREQPAHVAVAVAPAEPPTAYEPPTPTEAAPEEVVLLGSDRLTASPPSRQEAQWPRWGWPLVITITVCAIAAFAAVALGIWAIEHRTTTTRTVTVADTRAAPALADPVARRLIGTASEGSVILRLNPAGAALAVDGLPRPAPGHRYRVWLTDAGTTTAAGGFTGRRAILALGPLATGSRVTITREADGAPPDSPHGPRVATVTVPP